MRDLREAGCDILTIGQYLRPSPEHLRVEEYIRPEKFQQYERIGRSLGFLEVVSGPFVRSSYHADKVWELISKNGGNYHEQDI